MTEQFQSLRHVHLGRLTVAERRFVLNRLDAPPIRSATYRACPKQWEPERKEIQKMREAGVAETAITEWA